MSLSTDLLDVLSRENKVFVAFSGGLDSTALLFLCNKALKEKKISNVYFDRGGYKYHGRIKALADSLRKNGLKI